MKSVTAMCCAMAFSAVTLSAAQSGTMDKDKMDKMDKDKMSGNTHPAITVKSVKMISTTCP
jgi:hypothetical protein